MGLSSSKQKTTSNETTNQTGTTTPQNPSWVTDSISDWVGRIGSMMDADPNGFVAPASPLQQKAWNNTGQLDAWKGQMQSASDLAFRAANGGANLMGAPSQATAAQRQAATYAAPQLGAASLASTATAQAGTHPGTAQTNWYGYDAQQAGQTQIDPATWAHGHSSAASEGYQRMSPYQNAHTQQVVDTTLADFDADAGRARAAQAAQAAKAGAFGGSRFALREAQTEGELARARASTDANLRSQGFNTAAALGMADADRVTTNNQLNADRFNLTSRFNAEASNSRATQQAALDQQRNLYNADAGTRAAEYGATARNNQGQFNVGQMNQMRAADADRATNVNLFNAGQTNAANLANQGAQNQFALSQFGANADAARYGADARNAAGAENMGAQNQFALTNMGALNDQARFNAGQQDAAAGRALQGAGLMGDLANQYGAGVRSDLGLMATLGDQQRQIEQAYRMSPLAQLEIGGKLLGGTPFGLFNGQQIQTNGTSSGTQTTTGSPSLFSQLLAAGSLATDIIKSDVRAKRDIRRIGEHKGLGLYEYRYKWDAPDRPLRTGVMAQEVAAIAPDALGPTQDGFMTVNYGRLGLAHLVEA